MRLLTAEEVSDKLIIDLFGEPNPLHDRMREARHKELVRTVARTRGGTVAIVGSNPDHRVYRVRRGASEFWITETRLEHWLRDGKRTHERRIYGRFGAPRQYWPVILGGEVKP